MNHAIEAQHPFRHSTPIQLRFNDMDAFQHINNSAYFEYFDLAKTAYFKALDVNQEEDWSHPSIIIANVNCSFLVSTHFEEPVEVRTQCARLGDKSLTLLQHLVNTDTGEVKCTCATVMVNLEPATGKPSTIPQVWRDAFTRFEGHEI